MSNTDTANDMADGKIDSMLTVDVQYNYNFGELAFLSDSNVTLVCKTSLMKDHRLCLRNRVRPNTARRTWQNHSS